MEAYDALGFVFESLHDDTAAVRNYEKAIQLNEARAGRFSTPYVNLSALHNKAGNADLAIQNARKAIEFNPKSDGALFQMARAYQSRNEWSNAAEAAEKAVSINPRVASYYYVLGTAYRRLGKQKESQDALAIFQKLEREAAEFEDKRRQARGGETAPGRKPQ